MKHSTQLPKDYSRCQGVGCEIRSECERWLQRAENVGPRTNFANTLNSHGQKECFYFIRRR